MPVGAVVVVGRRAGGEVGDAALGIDADLTPDIGAADVLVGLLRPGVVAELARMRNRTEAPDFLAGDDVVGADVAWRRHVVLASRGAENDEVLEDLSRVLDCTRPTVDGSRPAKPFFQVDRALVAERDDRLAGDGIDRFEELVALIEQPPVLAILALPVVDAAGRHALQPLVDPDLLARRRVERHQRVVPRQHVHDVVDDDRAEHVREVVAGRILHATSSRARLDLSICVRFR